MRAAGASRRAELPCRIFIADRDGIRRFAAGCKGAVARRIWWGGDINLYFLWSLERVAMLYNLRLIDDNELIVVKWGL